MDANSAFGWVPIAFAAIVAAGLIAFGVWQWQDVQDKRICRNRGGEVRKNNGEWRCAVPPTERAP